MIESFLSGINCIINNKIIKPTVTPPVSPYITFVDPIVKQICVANWGSNGEITYEQAAAVTDLNGAFDYWSNNPPTEQITSFNELQYFTGLTILGESPDGNGQFTGAEELTSIILPPNLTIIGYNTFNNCLNLTSVVIPNSVTSIGDKAFNNCIRLTSITIGNSVTSIGDSAFSDCNELTSVIIPNSVTSIGDDTFAACSVLTSIIIPDSVTSIGNTAFAKCFSLTSITIGNSVTSIGNYPFANCFSLTSIIVKPLTPPIGEGEGIFLENDNLINIYVPSESVDAYKAAPYWSNYADIISAIV